MLVRGKLVPILGRVCMDLTLLDVTDVPDTAIGDEVLVFGRDSTGFLPVDVMATAIGTIGYEITTRIGKRLPRFHR
jgi:alanine racemase